MNSSLQSGWVSGSQAAAQAIGTGIVAGEPAEGMRLPREAELSARLRVSRNTLREAMRLLAAKSLIHIAPRRGTIVADRSEWNVFDPDVLDWFAASPGGADARLMTEILELRRMVEPFAAERAAERGAATAIIAAIDRMEDAVRADDLTSGVEADLAFHVALASAAGNRFVTRIGRSLAHALRLEFDALVVVPGNLAQNVANHRAVADAVAAADPGRARMAMERLLDRAEADTKRLLANSG